MSFSYVSYKQDQIKLDPRPRVRTILGSKQNQIRLKSENSRSKKRSDDIDIMPSRRLELSL